MTGAALAARGVGKRFGRAAALRDVELEVAPGRCLAVLGPNGAGKSTLLRLFAGLARPTTGRIEIDGHPAADRRSRGRVGYLGHSTLLSGPLTVRENLRYAARLHGGSSALERADARLEAEGLGPLAEKRADALSRGQAQRVAIARALVHDPDVLLLDEPYTGLDAGAAARLTARLSALVGEGRTAVLVTHETGSVRTLADEALVLQAGRPVWRGAGDAGALEAALVRALAGGERAA